MLDSPGFRLVTVLSFTIAILGLGAQVSLAQTPVGSNQHFIGLVNGSNTKVVVYTVCPGPLWRGREGPVAGGQTMLVAEVHRGRGFTGPFSQINSWFVPRH